MKKEQIWDGKRKFTFALNIQVTTEDVGLDEIIQRECSIKRGLKIDSRENYSPQKLVFNRQGRRKERAF